MSFYLNLYYDNTYAISIVFFYDSSFQFDLWYDSEGAQFIHQRWHKRTRYVLYGLNVKILKLLFISTGGHLAPYWMGYLRADECQLHFDWLVLTLTYNGLMALICLILQIRLYLFIRYCIDYSANADRSSNDNTANPTAVPVVATTAVVFLNSHSSGYCCEQHAQSNNSRPRSTFISCPSGQRLSWLEMRAAKILTVGILPFCFINLPYRLWAELWFILLLKTSGTTTSDGFVFSWWLSENSFYSIWSTSRLSFLLKVGNFALRADAVVVAAAENEKDED